jgi:pseudaminic acid biosynthesis-associated methylase
MNEQQDFWSRTYADEYMRKNADFDAHLGEAAWRTMLANTSDVQTILECGCNIGRNVQFLNLINPNFDVSIVELSKPAYEFVTSSFQLDEAFHGPIVESKFTKKFDLVYSMGVLIHIHPDDLLANMDQMFQHSSKYILLGEYFSRAPQMIRYQGEENKLFKRDFGKLFLNNFDVELVDHGFLWGHIYDDAGFDDINWWLFKK